ncbi:ribosomal protein S5 domain 2-like protein [Paxillus ammoniavirescens]|nr:ribosomal protein S5 domain 2-like protein [Paxillus ammoniavirescens]
MNPLSKAEKSYIQSSLLSDPPLRLDGRSPEDYRLIALETGVAPLANGSARVCIGRSGRGGDTEEAGGTGGGTEVVVGVKLEVSAVGDDEDGGKVVCTVSCSPAAYPTLSSNALDDLQSDLTTLIGSVLSHPSLRPGNLLIVPGKKAWVARLDAVVFADGGNLVDCLMLGCRAALWDTKVPRTRAIEYRAPGKKGAGDKAQGEGMDVDAQGEEEGRSALEPSAVSRVTDFELTDYWDEGEVLEGRDTWPVCVTLNVLPSMHFLDATLQEEASVSLRTHVMYAFSEGKPILQTFRLAGTGTSDMNQIRGLIEHAEKYARNVWAGLEAKLKEEEARRGVKAREKFYGERR